MKYYFDALDYGPQIFIPVSMLLLAATIFLYGAFPVIFSLVRKNSYKKIKYITLCYGVNAIALVILFIAKINWTFVPYLLWTSIFCKEGIEKLNAKGVFVSSRTNSPESKNKRSFKIDLVNTYILMIVLINVLMAPAENENYAECYILISLIGLIPLVLIIFNLINSKNYRSTTIISLFSLFAMICYSLSFFDGYNIMVAVCLIYLFVCEIFNFK